MTRKAGGEHESIIPLISLAARYSLKNNNGVDADRFYEKACTISNQLWGEDDPRSLVALAEWAMAARGYRGIGWSKSRLKDAYKGLINAVGQEHPDTLKVEFYLARLLLDLGEEKKAIKSLEELADHLDAHPHRHSALWESVYTILIHIYDNLGKNEALNDIISKFSQSVSEGTTELLPVLRRNPSYPEVMYRNGKGGFVDMEFTVDEFGKPINIQIYDSEGGPAFHRPAIKALKQWRYRPIIQNGKVQPYECVKVRITFKPH